MPNDQIWLKYSNVWQNIVKNSQISSNTVGEIWNRNGQFLLKSCNIRMEKNQVQIHVHFSSWINVKMDKYPNVENIIQIHKIFSKQSKI